MPKKRGNAASGRGQPKQLRRARIPSAETSQVSQQQHPQDLQFIISGVLSDDNTINDQRANIAAEANQATYRTVHNHRIMANDQGASIFESLEQMKEEIRDIRQELHDVKTELHDVKTELHDVKTELHDVKTELHDVKTELHDVKTELHDVKTELHDVKRELSEVRESLLNIRERNYLTFLCDHVTGYNRIHKDCICILTSSEVHGGDALLDASMFLSRRDDFPEERRLFQRIYGLTAEKLQELRSTTHPSILRVLNTVGYAHLSGKIALREEKLETTFDRVVELVEKGEIEEAERLASALSSNDFSYQCDE
ncbi:uncharacterized protein N7503_008094 [Penicillium pulvis]|uniref:uncharacterized protein n=1 Tax=Penicillium pulvis TaxID=1562058 RepID=UPI002549A73F|nr:uncharacterized protein N7503_008094 [Penicillium pulvis]KAJ5792116.1 hypothetical protein N7503_008094 [Penicillium pulvis]